LEGVGHTQAAAISTLNRQLAPHPFSSLGLAPDDGLKFIDPSHFITPSEVFFHRAVF
jgi:hypothetical protein